MIEAVVAVDSKRISVALFGQTDFRVNGLALGFRPGSGNREDLAALSRDFRDRLIWPDCLKFEDPILQELITAILFAMALKNFTVRTGDLFVYSKTAGFSYKRMQIQSLRNWPTFRKLVFGY